MHPPARPPAHPPVRVDQPTPPPPSLPIDDSRPRRRPRRHDTGGVARRRAEGAPLSPRPLPLLSVRPLPLFSVRPLPRCARGAPVWHNAAAAPKKQERQKRTWDCRRARETGRARWGGRAVWFSCRDGGGAPRPRGAPAGHAGGGPPPARCSRLGPLPQPFPPSRRAAAPSPRRAAPVAAPPANRHGRGGRDRHPLVAGDGLWPDQTSEQPSLARGAFTRSARRHGRPRGGGGRRTAPAPRCAGDRRSTTAPRGPPGTPPAVASRRVTTSGAVCRFVVQLGGWRCRRHPPPLPPAADADRDATVLGRHPSVAYGPWRWAAPTRPGCGGRPHPRGHRRARPTGGRQRGPPPAREARPL